VSYGTIAGRRKIAERIAREHHDDFYGIANAIHEALNAAYIAGGAAGFRISRKTKKESQQ